MASRRHTAKLALPRPAQWACDEEHEIIPEAVQTADVSFQYTEDRTLTEVTTELGEAVTAPVVTEVQRRLEITIPETAVNAYHEHGGCDPNTPIPDRLQTMVIEHAYDAYMAGTGDNLGPCTVRQQNGNYTLSYVYTGQTAATINLGSNWVLRADQTGPGPASLYADNTSTILNEWLPYQEAGRYLRVTGSNTLYSNFDTIMNGDGENVFVGLTENGRRAAQQMAMNPHPQPLLSPERLQIINKKAEALLLQHLSEAQRKTWLAEAYFDLLAPSGRRYRLLKGHFHNVFLLDQHGNRTREYCAYANDPGGRLPAEDNVFAQMLTIMYNENEFLAHANTWDLSSGKKVFVGQGRDVYLDEVMAA